MKEGIKAVFDDLLLIGISKKKELIEDIDNDDTKGYSIIKCTKPDKKKTDVVIVVLAEKSKSDELLDALMIYFETEEFKDGDSFEVACYTTNENGEHVSIPDSSIFGVDIT